MMNKKDKTYDLVIVIIDNLMNMIYYKLIKDSINDPSLVNTITNMIVQYHGPVVLIVSYQSLDLTFKFCSSLSYFLETKRKLSIAFYP